MMENNEIILNNGNETNKIHQSNKKNEDEIKVLMQERKKLQTQLDEGDWGDNVIRKYESLLQDLYNKKNKIIETCQKKEENEDRIKALMEEEKSLQAQFDELDDSRLVGFKQFENEKNDIQRQINDNSKKMLRLKEENDMIGWASVKEDLRAMRAVALAVIGLVLTIVGIAFALYGMVKLLPLFASISLIGLGGFDLFGEDRRKAKREIKIQKLNELNLQLTKKLELVLKKNEELIQEKKDVFAERSELVERLLKVKQELSSGYEKQKSFEYDLEQYYFEIERCLEDIYLSRNKMATMDDTSFFVKALKLEEDYQLDLNGDELGKIEDVSKGKIKRRSL